LTEGSLSERWIRWVLAHHRAILVLAAILTVVAGLRAAALRVNGDLRVLLPGDHPVVTSLEAIETSFGSTNSVNFVAKGGDVSARHAFTDALAAELQGHELLRDVEHGLPSKFFEEHALYYLTDAEFEDLDELVQGWSHFEMCSRAPESCVTAPDPEAKGKLRDFIHQKRDEAFHRTGFRDRYEREGVEAEVLLAHPLRPANELEFAREVTEAMRAVAEEVYARPDEAWSGTDMTYNVLGPYITKADEHRTILGDMVRSVIVAIVGVVVILYMLFRSQRAVLVLLVPLMCGVVWSLGAAEIFLGRLNVMTSTISTVVMGVGIDAGIHFLSRARRERLEHDDTEAIVRAFRGLIAPLLVASTTTFVAFASMTVTDFPAFREFGIIAALGVLLCLLSMVTVLPALCLLTGIKERKPRRPYEYRGVLTRVVLARPGTLAIVLAAVSVLSVFGVQRVRFEYNARELQSDQARLHTESDARLISEVFGKDIHSAVLVRPTVEEAYATLQTARARQAERLAAGEPTYVAEFLGVPDLLPAPDLDLDARKDTIDAFADDNADILDELEERAADHAKLGHDGDEEILPSDVALLRRMLGADPFTVEDLPPVLLHKLRAEDGSWALFAYPNFDVADMRQGMDFMEETRGYLDDPERGIFVGETVVYAAMYMLLRQEAPFVLLVATVLIALLVYWQVRSVAWTVLTLVPLALSLWWMLAVMGLFDLRFTLFNLPILPAILGIGVDNGVYLVSSIRKAERGAQGLADAMRETGGAIMAATATTAVGFGAFMVAASGGVRGIGAVAALGISMAAAVAILVLPTLAALSRARRS
jgi:predicted RND superfamily exporter protein